MRLFALLTLLILVCSSSYAAEPLTLDVWPNQPPALATTQPVPAILKQAVVP